MEEIRQKNFTFCFNMITDLLQQNASTGRSDINQSEILQKIIQQSKAKHQSVVHQV